MDEQRVKSFIENWNDDTKPFTWTVSADEIIAKF